MFKRFIYAFAFFKPIEGPVKFKKIQHNQSIHKAKSINELTSFYHLNGVDLNMINLVSYIRRYTDFMIQYNKLDSLVELRHTQIVLKNLQDMIESHQYKNYGDQSKDYKRSFIMLLSLSVELVQRINIENYQKEFLYSAKTAINNLKDQLLLEKCNLEELSVYMRCITQIKELNPSEEEEIECWALISSHIESINPRLACKLLHSLSIFKTFNENVIGKLLLQLEKANNQEFNQKDATSLFYSLRHVSEKTNSFSDSIQLLFIKIQKHMLTENYKLTPKSIGMIYNALAIVQVELNQEFLDYLLIQLIKCNQLTILCLSQLFQFYQAHKNIQLQISEQLDKKICQFFSTLLPINSLDYAEQFIMLFNNIGNYCTPQYAQLFIPILKQLPINDFILGKLFSGLIKLPFTKQFQELCEISVQLLQKYDNIINIHALNSIYRAMWLQNGQLKSIIKDVVDVQINQYSEQIIVKDYLYLISKYKYFESFELLQVLIDFLKVYDKSEGIAKRNTEILNQTIKSLIKEIEQIQNNKVKEKKNYYIKQFVQFM